MASRILSLMTLYPRLIAALWLVFIAYWAVSSFRAKRNVGDRRPATWMEIALRFGIAAMAVVVLRVPALRHALRGAQAQASHSPLLGLLGTLLCALGVGLAVWARFYLGRNWGLPTSRKEDPELVTTGPYAFVRHPIYGGLLLAMLGSTLGASLFWALPFVLFGVYFHYCTRREEKLMTEQFPEQYPAYRKRTKRFLPFVL